MKTYKRIALLFFIGFTGGIAGNLVGQTLFPPQFPTKETNSLSLAQTNNETTTTQTVSLIQDAVVSVINYQASSSANLYSIFGTTLEHTDELTVAGEGSGVIYKKEGNKAYLVTNNHVIANAEKIDILLATGEKIPGELVGADTYSDIAVIRIDAEKVTTIAHFADSDTIKVGETAIAIGSPLGSVYANTVTQGIVSSLSRTVTSENETGQTISTAAIQTDAAINPGNSGGPLININGQVIGITSSKITSSSASHTQVPVEGMGFAIPSNDAVHIISQLESKGKVIRPALGIRMVNVTELSSSQLEKAGLTGTTLRSGVLVVSTEKGLPADGKLESYDVILAIGQETINDTSDLQSALYKHSLQDTIEVTYMRKGKKQTIDIHLTHSTESLTTPQ